MPRMHSTKQQSFLIIIATLLKSALIFVIGTFWKQNSSYSVFRDSDYVSMAEKEESVTGITRDMRF